MSIADQTQSPTAEAARVLTICNACRYCEGLCAVFPAIEQQKQFHLAEVQYLANLCHGCRACFADCQYSPPHEFAVNIPLLLGQHRVESYEQFAWPPVAAALFRRNGWGLLAVTILTVAGFLSGIVWAKGPRILHSRTGQFYDVVPHAVMAWLFGIIFVYAIVATGFSLLRYWRQIGGRASIHALAGAVQDAASLKYLGGAGEGCPTDGTKFDNSRRLFHHLVFYGFLLCFAATSIGTIYHYIFRWEAPYRVLDLPVLLGALGGTGILCGTVGFAITRRPSELVPQQEYALGTQFLWLLGAAAATGLTLLILRKTSLMAAALAIHLGVIAVLFMAMPYGKFVHSLFRLASLIKYNSGRQH